MRNPTEYNNLRNRCPLCGHRLVMRDHNRCAVINGDGNDPQKDHQCRCANHKR